MEWIHWALLLAVAALVVAVLELFVPSGGVLAILSGLLFVAAIFIIAMQYGPAAGFACLAVALVVVPIVGYFLLSWWPNSPMGRRILGKLPTDEDVKPDSEQDRMLRDLVGKVGVAKSVMLPSGAAIICGRTVNAISEGLPVEAGQNVEVVEVRGNRVVVRKTDAEVDDVPGRQPRTEVALDAAPQESTPPEPSVEESQLAQSIDDLGLEPLDDLSESK